MKLDAMKKSSSGKRNCETYRLWRSLRAVCIATGRFNAFSKCNTWTGLMYILLIRLIGQNCFSVVSPFAKNYVCIAATF